MVSHFHWSALVHFQPFRKIFNQLQPFPSLIFCLYLIEFQLLKYDFHHSQNEFTKKCVILKKKEKKLIQDPWFFPKGLMENFLCSVFIWTFHQENIFVPRNKLNNKTFHLHLPWLHICFLHNEKQETAVNPRSILHFSFSPHRHHLWVGKWAGRSSVVSGHQGGTVG